MAQKYNQKMNLNLAGTSFTDETHSDVGSSAFTLDHDWFINDVPSGDVLVIRTAAAGGGTLLIENTDYTITNNDTILSDADHVNKQVYSDITITNAVYQSGALYFSGKYVADSIDKADVSQVTWQYEAVSTSQTLAPTGYTVYGCTAGTNGIRLTLPTPSEYNKGLRMIFKKLDDTNSAVTLIGTIDGLSYFFLISANQKVELMSTGSNYVILSGTWIADSGYVNRSDWTNVEIGTPDITFDGKVGTFLIGELVKEATSNNTGIVVGQTATVLYIWRATGTGIWTNDRVITGQISTATCNVNNASTTKNLDANFYHGFGVGIRNLTTEFILSTATTGTDATSFIYGKSGRNGGDPGYQINQIDTNSFKWQMSNNGGVVFDDAGAPSQLAAQDYSYRIIAKLII